MSSVKPACTARRLIKVASLGLAGLLVGLLTGCSASNLAVCLSTRTTDPSTTEASRRVQNLEYRRMSPAFRRAPVPHHGQPYSPQRTAFTTQASLGEIDAMGHHYVPRAGQ